MAEKLSSDAVRQAVRTHYADIARQKSGGCGCGNKQTSCCGTSSPRETSRLLGYSDAELDAGDAANLGLGCGNPQAIASIGVRKKGSGVSAQWSKQSCWRKSAGRSRWALDTGRNSAGSFSVAIRERASAM